MPGKNMAKTTTKTLLAVLLSLIASAALSQNQGGNTQGGVSAPEIDPTQALGALALLGGTLAIIRGYRHKKKK